MLFYWSNSEANDNMVSRLPLAISMPPNAKIPVSLDER